ncbi:MAG: hypothetical protein NVS2B4_05770 [Ramlibacter sp.]
MRSLLAALAAALLSLPLHAQDLALQVEHVTTSVGSDGVTRSTRFEERLVRRDDQSWLERIVPPVVHDRIEPKADGSSHKHADVAAASRWVTRGADGKLAVRIVDAHLGSVFEVGKPDYANVGFDGEWTTASQLLDPRQVRTMAPMTRAAPKGARWYELVGRDHRVQLLWDERDQFPRRIESSNASGTLRSVMTATREPMPARMPWTGLESYRQRDYSDLLD